MRRFFLEHFFSATLLLLCVQLYSDASQAGPPRTSPASWSNSYQRVIIAETSARERLIVQVDPDIYFSPSSPSSVPQPSNAASHIKSAPTEQRSVVVVPINERGAPLIKASIAERIAKKISTPPAPDKLQVIYSPSDSTLMLRKGERSAVILLETADQTEPLSASMLKGIGWLAEKRYKDWTLPHSIKIYNNANKIELHTAEGIETINLDALSELPPNAVTFIQLEECSSDDVLG